MDKKQEFEQILDVFTQPGWKYIVEDIKKRYDTINNIDDVSSVEELYKRKGEIDALRWIFSLKEWYQYSFELHEAQDEDF